MSLSGDLSDFSVEHVLRLLELSRSTGRLTVRASDAKVIVEVQAGAVSAIHGDDDGEVALGLVLPQRAGTFTFAAAPVDGTPLAASLDELLARSRAKAAEALEVRATITSDEVRFRISDRAMTGGSFTLTPAELRVLTAVGGGRNVKELRRSLRLPPQTVRSLLHALLRKELVVRTETLSEIAVETTQAPEARPRPKRARPKAAPDRGAAPEAPPVQVVEVVAADRATRAAAPELDEPALRDELDARLAALETLPPAAAPTASADDASQEGPSEEDEDELIVVTPTAGPPPTEASAGAPEATVVFRLHYMPETVAPPPPPEAPAAPKRRGIFDLLLRRGSAKGAKDEPEALDIPSPAELGALANALQEEYVRLVEARSQLESYAERSGGSAPEAIPARLGRIYAARPIGARVPVSRDGVDVVELGRGEVPPAQVLPYLALLVRDIRDEMRRTLGDDEARVTYDATVARIFGRSVPTPTRILRVAERPLRGRLTIRTGPGGGPFELRDRTYVIGRSPACDIVVSDPSVSGRHARLVPDVVGFRLSDLGSTNGTRVNGEALKSGDRVLHGGEQIGLGDTVLVYEHLATVS